MTYQLKRKDLLYSDLTDKIISCVFKVYGKLGGELLEKYYQRALAVEFANTNLKYSEQLVTPLFYEGVSIGRYFLDFLVEDKVVVEIKKHNNFGIKNIEQLYNYLKANKLQIGLLVNFSKNGVKIKRVANILPTVVP